MMTSLKRYVAWLRLPEAVQVSGFASAGLLFAFPDFSQNALLDSLLFFGATFLTYGAVYSFNSYCGYDVDIRNERLSYVQGSRKGLFAGSTLVFLVIGLPIYAFLDPALAIIGAVSFALWALYSLPRIGMKHFPIAGTMVHLATQFLNFQMAFLLLTDVSAESLLLGVYFALLFAGGHLHHELIDYRADKDALARTSAVFIGQRNAVRVYAGVVLLSGLYWLGLGIKGVVQPWELIPFLGAPSLQLATMFYLDLPNEVRFNALLLNRRLYRFYYVLAFASYMALRFSALGA